MKETKELIAKLPDEKLEEIMITVHNIRNHNTFFSNPGVWRDIKNGNVAIDEDDIMADYKVDICGHEYRYYAYFERLDENLI